jgi:hypothetical protein
MIDQRTRRPAGQIIKSPPTASAPTAPALPPMSFGADGRITGLDGVLDQIGESLSRQATPLLRDVMLPIIQRDKELQKTIGAAAGIAAGNAAANQLRVPLILLGVGVTSLAAVLIWKTLRDDE